MIRVIVNGIDGAMGSTVVKCVEATDDMEVVAGITPTGWNGAYLTPAECNEEADVLIDFSHHDGTKALVDYCVEKGLPAVICTTGQTEEENKALADAILKWRGPQQNYPTVPDGGTVNPFTGGTTREQFESWAKANLNL